MSAAQSHTLEIRNDLSELRRVSDWLHATAALMALPEGIRFDLDLCAAEAVQNVIAYAYGDSASHVIRVRVTREPERVELDVEDDGAPFNPLEYEPPPPARSLDEAPLGGRGIRLIRGVMTECRYRRSEGRNVFTMSRALA